MAQRYKSRFRLGVTLLLGLFLLINALSIALLSLTRQRHKALEPLLLTFLLVTFTVGLPSIVLLVRNLFRPHQQLVDEAERAPVEKGVLGERDETEFVLKTFQTVVAEFQSQGQQLEKLRAMASARAESAKKFSERIVASVPSGLIAFSADGRANMANDVARALVGVSAEAEGQSIRGLLRNTPELADLVEHCLKTGELHRREEFTVSFPTGVALRIGATVAPVEFQDNRGAICLLTDLTEVIELREALALKKNLESLGEMSAGLAHELKNSLAALHGYAQLLQTPLLSAKENQTAAAMLQEVRSLSEMVTAFLNFASPRPLNLSPTRLREVVDDCAEELTPLIKDKRVELSITGDFPTVSVDDRMLRQALINLVRNAAEAIDAEQPERRVVVKGSLQSDQRGRAWAWVEITDTGRGIPPEDLQRIFIPFFTTKSKGYGVGLALAHRVVTEHGGSITAANAPHGGACFTVKLPLSPA